MTDYQIYVDIFAICSSTAVTIALFFTYFTFRRAGKLEQIRLAERFHSDMQRIRGDMSPYFDLDPRQENYEHKLKLMDENIFNVLEWNAYLVRTKIIKDESLICHFKNAFLEWHKVFEAVMEDKKRKSYTQFQKLVGDQTRQIRLEVLVL